MPLNLFIRRGDYTFCKVEKVYSENGLTKWFIDILLSDIHKYTIKWIGLTVSERRAVKVKFLFSIELCHFAKKDKKRNDVITELWIDLYEIILQSIVPKL